jgi:hypothetical protein
VALSHKGLGAQRDAKSRAKARAFGDGAASCRGHKYWKPTHFEPTVDVAGNPLHQVFGGIDVILAVRDESIIYRVSYHITLVGKIVFRRADGVSTLLVARTRS